MLLVSLEYIIDSVSKPGDACLNFSVYGLGFVPQLPYKVGKQMTKPIEYEPYLLLFTSVKSISFCIWLPKYNHMTTDDYRDQALVKVKAWQGRTRNEAECCQRFCCCVTRRLCHKDVVSTLWTAASSWHNTNHQSSQAEGGENSHGITGWISENV